MSGCGCCCPADSPASPLFVTRVTVGAAVFFGMDVPVLWRAAMHFTFPQVEALCRVSSVASAQ